MMVIPMVNKNRKGDSIIYNIELELKGESHSKIKEGTIIKGYEESDIIINGTSYNNSVFNIPNGEANKTVNFLRYFNTKSNKKNFLITTKEYPDSNLYDVYSVEMPPRKISGGLDNLYGSAILDMKNEIPGGKPKGRVISLKKLGIDRHITENKIDKLKEIIAVEKNEERRQNLMQLNGVSDLQTTVDYVKKFKYTILNTIQEEQFKNILDFLELANTKEYKNLLKYYETAKDNMDVYKKLTRINKILYGKPIDLIESKKKSKVLVKTIEKTKDMENKKDAA